MLNRKTTLTAYDRRAMRIGQVPTWYTDWDSGAEDLVDQITDEQNPTEHNQQEK